MTKIQILGTGCPKCARLAENAEAAARQLGIEYEIEKITSIAEIAEFGVMITPALAIDGDVATAGQVPETGTLVTLLRSRKSP